MMNEDEFKEWADRRIRGAQVDAEVAAAYYRKLIQSKMPDEYACAMTIQWMQLNDNDHPDATT